MTNMDFSNLKVLAQFLIGRNFNQMINQNFYLFKNTVHVCDYKYEYLEMYVYNQLLLFFRLFSKFKIFDFDVEIVYKQI